MTFTPRPLTELAESWPAALDHISASSVKMIARCPEQWRQRYMLGRKTAPAAALIAGRADHAAIEMTMRQKIVTHVDLPVQEVVDEFHNVFETEVNFAGVKEIEVKSRGEQVKAKAAKVKILDALKVEGGQTVASYHTQASPQVQPTAVEEEFSFRAPRLPVRVDGRIDLLAEDGTKPYMIDRKRSGRAKYKPDPEWIIQAEVYQLAKRVPHAWHISVAGGSVFTPANNEALMMKPKRREIAETQLEHLCAEIGYLYMRYGPDAPWPTRGKLHPWACGYCGYRDNCWGWR